jgi:hypothetical protein
MLRDTMINDKNTEILHFEIENFSVSTDVKFLFDIGKICSQFGCQIPNGIESIKDFMKIMNYYREDMDKMTYKKMMCDSQFYLAKLHIHNKEFFEAERQLREMYFDAIELDSRKNE